MDGWRLGLALAAVAAGLAAVPPPAHAASASPMPLGATDASGWLEPANALSLADDSYAHTASDGAVLALGAFADAAPRGPVSSVTLRIDQQQASHRDDALAVSVSSPGCPSASAPSPQQPTASRAVLSVALSCPGGWTWAAINGLSATLTAEAVGSLLLVSGVDGEWRAFGAWLEVAYVDEPPTADAGPDRTAMEGEAVALDGSASSDPEGLPLAYAWRQQSGPAVALQQAQGPRPSFAAPTLARNDPVEVVLELTVTDADGQSSSDTVRVGVRNVNGAPTAAAGSDQSAAPGAAVALAGGGSLDPDGDALAFHWDQVGGAAVALSDAAAPAPTFTAPAGPDTLRFQLVVRDPLGASSAPDVVQVQVAGPPAGGVPPPPPPAPPASSTSSSASSTSSFLPFQPTTTGAPPAPVGSATASPGTVAPGSPAAAAAPPAVAATVDATVRTDAPAGPSGVAAVACDAVIPGVADGAAVAVRLRPECGILAAVVELGPQARNATFVARPAAPGETGLPDPPGLATAAVVRLGLVDAAGAPLQPRRAVLRFGVDAAWAAAHCDPATCRLQVHHGRDGAWEPLPTTRLPDEEGRAVVEAATGSFSLFAVGAVPLDGGGRPAGTPWGLWAGLGGLAALGALGAVGAVVATRATRARRRAPGGNGSGAAPAPAPALAAPTAPTAPAPPGEGAGGPPDAAVDARVSRLVQEMRANEDLLQFVNSAAHDLANPLTPINLQLSMLSAVAGQDAGRRERALGIVRRNVDQLALLIRDLKDAARLQAGKMRVAPARIDLGQVAAEAVESYQAQAQEAGLDLSFEAGPPLAVDADRVRVTQVLGNLLNNALKFTPKGGRVRVTAAREVGWAVVLVRDSGLGLTAEDRARLFRPFSQAHGEREKAKGTGLGLYICKGIAEAHGGRIGCDSQGPGTGSAFWISLPLAAGEAGAPVPQPVPPPVPPPLPRVSGKGGPSGMGPAGAGNGPGT